MFHYQYHLLWNLFFFSLSCLFFSHFNMIIIIFQKCFLCVFIETVKKYCIACMESRNICVPYFVPGLFTLVSFMLALIGAKNLLNFQRPSLNFCTFSLQFQSKYLFSQSKCLFFPWNCLSAQWKISFLSMEINQIMFLSMQISFLSMTMFFLQMETYPLGERYFH